MKHDLSLDESGCLVVKTERPARILFTYKISGDQAEGGVYYFERVIGPAGQEPENVYRLRPQFMEALKKCAAKPTESTFSVMAEYGGFARVELPKADVMALLK